MDHGIEHDEDLAACAFAYGLASLRAEALLFVGNDFARTDVAPAPHAGS